MIHLKYCSGSFDERLLVSYIVSCGRNYIVQGQQTCKLDNHTKPQSLDYWLRQFAENPDTKQAENSILDDLVSTGLFARATDLLCPDSGRRVKGLILT